MSLPHVPPAKARLAGLVAHRDPADPEITEARRDLITGNLAAHIRRVVNSAPRPTDEQFAELRALLPAPAGAGHAAT